jgi:hypothetical protein
MYIMGVHNERANNELATSAEDVLNMAIDTYLPAMRLPMMSPAAELRLNLQSVVNLQLPAMYVSITLY